MHTDSSWLRHRPDPYYKPTRLCFPGKELAAKERKERKRNPAFPFAIYALSCG